MFTPEKMVQISVLFSGNDVEKVAECVIRNGSIQIADAADMDEWAGELGKSDGKEISLEIRQRREKIESLVKSLKLSDKLIGVAPVEGDWKGLDPKIVEIDKEFQANSKTYETALKKLQGLREIKTRTENFPKLSLALKSQGRYSYLTFETGQIPERNFKLLEEKLQPILHVLIPLGTIKGMTSLLSIVLKRDSDLLKSALKNSGFQPLQAESEVASFNEDLLEHIDEEIENAVKQVAEIESRLRKIAEDHQDFLKSALYRIRHEKLTEKVVDYFRKTDKTYLLAGWLPENERRSFKSDIKKATHSHCVITETPAEKVASVKDGKLDVPVKLNNPGFFKPFELLTTAYGLPVYKTIDPTPFLGISFLLMFGMMFGDVGHGFVLALAGALLAFTGKKDIMKRAGLLALYAGIASIGYGFLFGSIFGLETVLPAIWLKPIDSIGTLFKVVIYFGIGMITFSIIINIINGIISHDILGCIFNKAGLLSGLLYWCAVILVTRMLLAKTGTTSMLVPILMIVAGVLLFLQEPIVHLLKGKKLFPEGVATSVMGGIVEMLEIGLGFLANTVSFIRVAAFGLAHVGLFMAVFSLSNSVNSVAASALIQVFGNILIIVLEGLVVTIQAIRLEFYEFFGRFFQLTNSEYIPIREKFELK
ncbi:MAG: V-type ATPase 116kDa subunit family protein [Candidatus Marinimicrobia bacterium]|nr:V-type ATPase 116kDa subunit family protein [Candidatus Neomarinimicrobiota bacterium]